MHCACKFCNVQCSYTMCTWVMQCARELCNVQVSYTMCTCVIQCAMGLYNVHWDYTMCTWVMQCAHAAIQCALGLCNVHRGLYCTLCTWDMQCAIVCMREGGCHMPSQYVTVWQYFRIHREMGESKFSEGTRVCQRWGYKLSMVEVTRAEWIQANSYFLSS